MTRPKKINRLSIAAGKWYTAAELMELGWGGFCCAEGLSSLLRVWSVIHGLDCDRADDDVDWYEKPASQRYRFRFKSRSRAKMLRTHLAIEDVEKRLAGGDESRGICVCEANGDPWEINY
jgi:hypothetical protein